MNLRPYLSLLTLLLAAMLLSVAVGAVFIPPGVVLRMLLSIFPGVGIAADWPESLDAIVFQIRLPHTALIALAGAALAGSGAVYQGVFRNPLADPYLIGVASGAGLGAVLGLASGWPGEWTGLYTVPIAAFIGAIATIALVYNLAHVGRTVPTTTF